MLCKNGFIFAEMLHHSHIENSDSKQRRKHCHQMHDKPKYDNGKCLINQGIGWVNKYMGEFYMWFVLFLFCSD